MIDTELARGESCWGRRLDRLLRDCLWGDNDDDDCGYLSEVDLEDSYCT